MEQRAATFESPGGRDAAARSSKWARLADRIASILAVSLGAGLTFLALNEPWVTDDFTAAVFSREHPGMWNTVAHLYETWTGRFTSSALSWFALQIRPVYGIALVAAILLLVVMSFALARGRLPRAQRGDLYVLALVLLAYWYAMPALEETVFWTAGSVVYLWPAALSLLFLYPYRRWSMGSGPARRAWGRSLAAALGMFLLGGFVGGSQEQVLVACGLYALLVFGKALREGRLRQAPLHLYSGAAGLVLAGAISLVAPGNGARLSEVPSARALEIAVAAVKLVVRIGVDWLPPLAPWLLCLGLLAVPVAMGRAAGTPREAGTWRLWVLLGAATVAPLLLQPFFGAERTIMFLAVFLVVAAVSLGDTHVGARVLDRLPAGAASAAIALLLLVGTTDVALSGWQARTLRLAQHERADLVARQKADGVLDVSVPRLSDEAPRRGVIWGDGTADPANWVNGVMAGYYGVSTLTVTEGPGQGYGADL